MELGAHDVRVPPRDAGRDGGARTLRANAGAAADREGVPLGASGRARRRAPRRTPRRRTRYADTCSHRATTTSRSSSSARTRSSCSAVAAVAPPPSSTGRRSGSSGRCLGRGHARAEATATVRAQAAHRVDEVKAIELRGRRAPSARARRRRPSGKRPRPLRSSLGRVARVRFGLAHQARRLALDAEYAAAPGLALEAAKTAKPRRGHQAPRCSSAARRR